jgi:peptidyl-prolyl cis-trans isomerase A (cyclophilin A)
MRPCFILGLGLALTIAASGQTAPKTSASPATQTTPRKPPTAVIHTTAGDLKCELFPDKAPNAVANFIGLATGSKPWTNPTTHKKEIKHPLYDGVIFHRTIPEFMIQSGDPMGTGNGDPGYTFDDELHRDLLYDRPGRLGMANSGINTNGSQFFITEKEYPSLNPCFDDAGCRKGNKIYPKGTGYTIFGQCDEASVAVVKEIARKPCTTGPVCSNQNSKPVEPVKIKHIEILNPGKAALVKPAPKPAKTNAPPSSSTPTK